METLALAPRPVGGEGLGGFLCTKATCKSVQSGHSGGGGGGGGVHSPLEVTGRRVSPSPQWPNPPLGTPHPPRRKCRPRAGPRGPDPNLQHEVLSLCAQNALGPPGQGHQVRDGRSAPAGTRGCCKSGAPPPPHPPSLPLWR